LIETGSAGSPLRNSNRLSRTILTPSDANPDVEKYQHDGHGNMVRLPHLGGGEPAENMHWDYRDHLHRVDLGGGGTAFHAYSASGQRVRKVWEKPSGVVEERIYLDNFEIFRRHAGAVSPETAKFQRDTLHVMDDRQRVALVETRSLDVAGDDPALGRLIRYQLGNHLGSAMLNLDEQARIISYEEYAPYGSSTYQAVRSQTETPNRYRYTGKERDGETGFYYFGGRYYMAWTGRWTQCDPKEFMDGANLYRYASANPVRFSDPTGFGAEEQRLGASMEKASKAHQDAANAVRAQKKLDPIDVQRQKGVGGKQNVIPDELKTTPKGVKQVVDTKARHVDSARNQSVAKRRADIEANLEQVKQQLVELEKAGEISSKTRGAVLRVAHDSDKGVSSVEAVAAWRKEALAVREEWIKAAATPAEKALRSRVWVTTTTRANYTRVTENLAAKARPSKIPKAGIIVGVAIAAYILFDTGDAYAAAQTLNPAANTTDVFASGNDVALIGMAAAVLKDAVSLTPPGAAAVLIWTLMQPTHGNYWDENLAKRAIEEGRNPFCAQCHGKGGALDPNNEYNERARQREFDRLRPEFDRRGAEAVIEWAASH
jgi:RHS repeat-associated protein